MSGDDELSVRVARLERWVDTVMGLVTGVLGDDLLCELDEARGAYEQG